MDTRRTPMLLSRIAGLSALGVVVGTLVYYTGIAPPIGPPERSSQEILAWVPAHQQRLLFQFVIGYIALLYAVLIVVLVELNGDRGVLAQLAYLGAGANIATALTYFGTYFGVWTYVQRGGTDQALVALYTGAESYAHAQLMATGLAVGAVGALSLLTRTLPRWLGWLGLLLGAEHVLTYIVFASFPAFSTTSTVLTAGAAARGLDIVLEYLWLLATGVVLLVRPVRQMRQTAVPTDPGALAPRGPRPGTVG